MIEPGYKVSYRDSFGWARTKKEAEEMEKEFKYRYGDENGDNSFSITEEDIKKLYPPFGFPPPLMG